MTYQNNSKSNNVLKDCEFSSENIGNQQTNFMHKEQSSYVSKEGIGNQQADFMYEEQSDYCPFSDITDDECVAESINTTAENNLTSNNTLIGDEHFKEFEENTENHEVSNIINAKNFARDDKESLTIEENETSINPLTNRNELKEHNTFMQSGVQQLSDSESGKMVEVTPFTPFSKRWSDAEPKQCLNTTRTDSSNLIKTPDINENVSSDNDEKSIAESVNITYQNNLRPSNALNETIFFSKIQCKHGKPGIFKYSKC
ncbi:hypothetical protein CEXT_659541 [Caerostris extrusa]|uniref:Exophilin 5 n=1 Tax=Caerostris extrusa TaxID=172846 RepID=A0AAV4PE22_CAEEX|nr:hypothetical protein CEXT_659541 [Caerostris extrusa]